jgi:hypothetical protein
MQGTYGVEKVRYQIVSNYKVSGTSAMGTTHVEAYNQDGWCVSDPTPPFDCYETALTNGEVKTVYGSMDNPGTTDSSAYRQGIWNAVAGGTEDQVITPDLTNLTVVNYDSTAPCTYVATKDTWFTAVLPKPLCFAAEGIDATAPHPANILTAAPPGCVAGFYAGSVARLQIKELHLACVMKIQLLNSLNAVIAEAVLA